MKRINSIYKVWIGLFFSSFLVFGQNEENDIGIQEVTITKSYTPSLSEVFKIREQPAIVDFIGREKLPLAYNISSVPVVSTFVPSKGRARVFQIEDFTSRYNATLSSSYGSFNHFYVDHSAQIELNRKQNLGWLFKYDGLSENIPEQILDTKQSSFLGYLSYEYDTNNLSTYSKLFFRNSEFNFYGLQNAITDQVILNNIDSKQQLNSFSLKSNWQWFDTIIEEIDLAVHLITDKFSTNELEVEMNTKFQFNIGDVNVGTNAMIRYLNNKFKADYFSDAASSFSSGISQVDLFIISAYKKDFKYKVGVRVAYGFGDDFAKNFYVFPVLDLSYQPIKAGLIPFLNASGEVTQNSFRTLVDINPYTAPAIILKNSPTPYEFKAGLRTKNFRGWEFTVNGYYQKQENKPLYRNFGYDNTNLSYDAFRYGNSFEVIYKEIKTIGFDASVLTSVKNRGSLSLKASWRDYSVADATEVWNLPEIQFDFMANIKVKKKIYVQTNITFFGERKNSYRQQFLLQLPEKAPEFTVNLPSFFDADAKLTYQLNSEWEIYLKGENLTNVKEFRWANYQAYGIRFLVGIRYNFDIDF